MNVFSNQDALILREVKYKEADRILTLYTSKYGLISAKATGALRKNSKLSAATQMLTYSDVTLLFRNGKYSVTEAQVIESFNGIRNEFESYSLGCYFAECVETVSLEGFPELDILKLILNSLYALSNNLYSSNKIKAAFELRLMMHSGYMPQLNNCIVCESKNIAEPTFGYSSGNVCCRKCRNSSVGLTDYLDEESLYAMRYIIESNSKQFLNFNISDESQRLLNKACEDYIITQTGKNFITLDYWKKIKL